MEESRIEELKTMPYDEYLETPEWAEKRDAALKRAGHRCQICNASGSLNVHHRTYENRGDERSEDLTVLCDQCHALFHISRVTAQPLRSGRSPVE
jgi:5-methylcytosine-specific restriction endonuclease McrA